jgi:hypothetical protein
MKTPNPKCCLYWCLIEFRDWIYTIQSVMLVFSTPLVNYCRSNLLTGSPPPTPPCEYEYVSTGLCIYTVWWGYLNLFTFHSILRLLFWAQMDGNRGARRSSCVESIYRSYTLCIRPESESTKLLYHPKKNLGGEGASDR